MPYTLMTGGTGLLGAYLLRDGLLAGRRFAVIARPSRVESARQRIDSLLARFEAELDERLPRPVVLEGDLDAEGLGLGADAKHWVRRHCDQFLHNAASLSFYHTPETGEPERSNVDGTRRALALCEEVGVARFHHVSTAYVCGLRTGVCRESELRVGQEWGNDYERSKVSAEEMVRGAGFLRQPTFYRPAIIVGDSRTGYTSSYHGFFTPLKVASALVDSFGDGPIDGTPIMAALGLKGHEQKNYVPVDWVSAVMTRLLGDPGAHGQTYHLTPRRRVTVQTTLRVIEDALVRRREARGGPAPPAAPPDLGVFREQMEVYRSYWRDDPEFDSTNTQRAVPDLPCPIVGYAALMRMANYALENGFGWPLPKPLRAPVDFHALLCGRFSGGDDPSRGAPIGLSVAGLGGGEWTLWETGGRLIACEDGLSHAADAAIYLPIDSAAALLDGSLTLGDAARTGRVHLEGADEPSRRRAAEALAALGPALAGEPSSTMSTA
ncbi:SDR family oxidoreductase [Botrimarina sp.]|uniref:SDR family oxidoreductase n=1 Tax=Botrimarina sp. TaxID=2795802 RepID=UPI0032EA95B4